MNTKTFVIVFLVAAISVSCMPATTIATRADNFAFVFKDIPCGSVPIFEFDTTKDTLIYRQLAPLGDTSSIKISVKLTDNELEAIYQKAMEIGFFEYPAKFVIPEDKVIGGHFPVSSYELSMTNDKMTNSVSWVDREIAKPDYTKADELKELMILIQDIIRLHPEVQQFGEPKAGCA